MGGAAVVGNLCKTFLGDQEECTYVIPGIIYSSVFYLV